MTTVAADRALAELKVAPDRLRLATAIGLFATEEATLGQGAAIAGLTQAQFLQELGRRGISFHYGVAELEEDIATLRELPPR
jgi:predicted HTH domain antitoxin